MCMFISCGELLGPFLWQPRAVDVDDERDDGGYGGGEGFEEEVVLVGAEHQCGARGGLFAGGACL